ncbi:MAG TPA: tetratricopeptide repeat protein [Thermoanaerobaculia bacterium]|nr:tetratricopeptide repeat protein [Thermoanaerobaculia bacterium]
MKQQFGSPRSKWFADGSRPLRQFYKRWSRYSRIAKATLIGAFLALVSLSYAIFTNYEAKNKDEEQRKLLEQILAVSMDPFSDIDSAVETLAKKRGLRPEELRLEILKSLDSSKSRYDQGLVAFFKKDFSRAAEYLQKSVDEARSDLAHRYFYLGNARYYSGDFEGAVAEWTKAIVEKPDLASAHYNIGNTYSQMGQDSAAIRKFTEALRRDPSFFNAHGELGNIYFRNGDFDHAAAEYRSVISGHEIWWAYFNLGGVYYKQGLFDRAVEALERAAALMPDVTDSQVASRKRWAATVYLRLGAAQKARGNLDGAIISYQSAISTDADFAPAYYNLGNLREVKGETEAAQTLFQRAIAVDNNYVSAYVNLADLLVKQGKSQAARTLLESVLRRRSGSDLSTVYSNLGEIAEGLEDIPNAVRNYTRALALDPEDKQSYLSVVKILRKRGLGSEAQQCLGSVFGIQPVVSKRTLAGDNSL